MSIKHRRCDSVQYFQHLLVQSIRNHQVYVHVSRSLAPGWSLNSQTLRGQSSDLKFCISIDLIKSANSETHIPSTWRCFMRSVSSSNSAATAWASPETMFPAPPLPVECTTGAWSSARPREREREAMLPAPPRPVEC
jgi:hypothetical protein